MQKKLIALAVAGLVSAPAFAQSNVQIYGVVDAGFVNAKIGDNKFNGVQSGLLSASRIGFRGTEDLGNGLKGVFTLEYGINVDSGTGPSTPRQSFVGLQGGFGFVGLGRQYSPGHNYAGMLDVMGGSAAFNTHLKTGATSIANGTPGRWDNAISYKSPSMSGFSVEAMYAFGESTDQADQLGLRDFGNAWGVGGGYKNGPIKAAAVYHRTDGDSLDDLKEWMVGGGYDFGVVDLNLSYTQAKEGDAKAKLWYANGAIPVSEAGKILLGYSHHKLEASGFSDQKIKAYTLAYTHNLSKRTTAYAGYVHVSNDDLTNVTAMPGLRSSTLAVPPNAAAPQVDEKSRGFTVGVRHTF